MVASYSWPRIFLVLPFFLVRLLRGTGASSSVFFRGGSPLDHHSSTKVEGQVMVLVQLRFDTSILKEDEWSYQLTIVSQEKDLVDDDDAHAESPSFVISTRDNVLSNGEEDSSFLVEFSLKEDRDYNLILECLKDFESSSDGILPTPMQVNVTIFSDNHVLLSQENLRLDTRAYAISFKTEPLTTDADATESRLLQQEVDSFIPRKYEKPPERPSLPPVSRPLVTPPPTQPGSITPTTPFDETKPPSPYSGNFSNTFAPSISASPSILPTMEPLCISTTNGSVPYDDKYIAITLDGDMTLNDTNAILAAIVDVYNDVATCDQNGAFRRMDTVSLVPVHDDLSAFTDNQWIIRLSGICNGCINSAQSFFGDATGTELTSNQCLCPGPSALTFQDVFNKRMVESNSTVTMLNVFELENEESCDTSMLQEDSTPDQYNTLVTFVLASNPSSLSETELQSIFGRFIDVVHSHLTIFYPTCDLSRKRILDVQLDPSNPIIGRELPRENRVRRDLQQTSEDFELVANVTFSCYGCQGRLFGKTNFTPNGDCLCPKGGSRYGVGEKDIVSALNDSIMNQRSLLPSVSDIIEIEPVPCSSLVSDFSTVVVMEYILKSNDTTVSFSDDLAVLDNKFVTGYNGMARRHCDPYFRRVQSAATIPFYDFSEDGLTLKVEMYINGTCRGNCTNDTPLYDPAAFLLNAESFLIGNMSSLTPIVPARQVVQNRQLQEGGDSTCYCSVAANRSLGPGEPEIVQNFAALVDDLSLESISEVAECRPLILKGGFRFNISTNTTQLTQSQLDLIGQTIQDAYNADGKKNGLCDKYFREIVATHVSPDNPPVDSLSRVRVLQNDNTPKGQSLVLTRTTIRPRQRRVQQDQSAWPSAAPSPTPSVNWNNNTTTAPFSIDPSLSPEIPIFMEFSGTCQGCPADKSFFDEISDGRRRMQGSSSNSDSNTTTNRCFCEPNATILERTNEPVIQALSTLWFINETSGFEEVEIVECSVEVDTFSIETPLDFLVIGDVAAEDEESIGTAFMTTYIELSKTYCDSLFRVPQNVSSTKSLVLSGPDQNGVSTVRFLIDLEGTCHGCEGTESLFDNKHGRRMQQEQDVCYCRKDTIKRAPTDEEFQTRFASVLGSGRRLQLSSKFTLLCVGSICDPLVPTFSPAIALVPNPNGIQNYPSCVVPYEYAVGDGYCDRDIDDNGDPIYNNVDCGYDAGDCCESTCIEFAYECGLGEYWCLDPNAQDGTSNTAANNALCAQQAGASLGDGVCDAALNIPFCNYDEGDCCQSTCGGVNGLTCTGTFQSCVDPNTFENDPAFATNMCKNNAACSSLSSFCGDGYCDDELNKAECGWDGGDCCQESCVSRVFECPTSPLYYSCRDPTYKKIPATCNVTKPENVGDGFCDVYDGYNTAECDFDGGDCCFETCVKSKYQCTFEACAKGLGLPSSCQVLVPKWVGDGFCDYVNPYNTPECNYDGGDCCPNTCAPKNASNGGICGFDSAYFCLNLTNPFYENLTRPNLLLAPNCKVPYDVYLGDGACYGSEYNTAECLWDFGDCCGETCNNNLSQWHHPYTCGSYGYDCKDPAVKKPPEIPKSCNASKPYRLGDGGCHDEFPYNTAACLWDFGDCCEQTCKNASWYHERYQCGDLGYNCLDPAVQTIPKPSIPSTCNVSQDSQYRLGDGRCNFGIYNTAECGWDFGDCCEKTCNSAPWNHKYECGYNGYDCKDTSVKPAIPTGCRVPDTSRLGDGRCDHGTYNTKVCGWDLGDCCLETCKSKTWYKPQDCGVNGYNCSDPSVTQLPKRPSVPSSCNVPVDEDDLLGNGWCDGKYNSKECMWDFGDCCEPNCTASLTEWYNQFQCGVNDYNCTDPSIPQRPAVPSGCKVDYPEYLGDGWCEGGAYNTEACDWEFGDCCLVSCSEAPWSQDYECGSNSYRCLNPNGGPNHKLLVKAFDSYEDAEGTYRVGSPIEYLFGQPVYYQYGRSFMLHWCKDGPEDGHWTLQFATNITKIAEKGCKGQGLQSISQADPKPCNVFWMDPRNTSAVAATMNATNCPAYVPIVSAGQAIAMTLTPTAVPSSSPSKLPSATPSVLPSVVPSMVPSKTPSAAPSTSPSIFVPSNMPSWQPSKSPTSP